MTMRDELGRRCFLLRTSSSLGVAALGSLLNESRADVASNANANGLPGLPHHAPRAKRIIYLVQSGAPSQMELFAPKPTMSKHPGEDLPYSIQQGQRP